MKELFFLWLFNGYRIIYANVGDFKDPWGQNLKRRFVSCKATPSNDRVLCVYATSGCNTREQLARGNFFERQQNYIEN